MVGSMLPSTVRVESRTCGSIHLLWSSVDGELGHVKFLAPQ